jgi:hypothetical protein
MNFDWKALLFRAPFLGATSCKAELPTKNALLFYLRFDEFVSSANFGPRSKINRSFGSSFLMWQIKHCFCAAGWLSKT